MVWIFHSAGAEGCYNILKKELVLFRDAFGGIEDDDNSTLVPGEIGYSPSSFFYNFANAFSISV